MQAVRSDASAALGIAHRRGRGGKTRHVKVRYLWIQDAVENKELETGRTSENLAETLTKFLANDALSKHAQRLSLSLKLERSSADKAAEALAGLSSLAVKLWVFTNTSQSPTRWWQRWHHSVCGLESERFVRGGRVSHV